MQAARWSLVVFSRVRAVPGAHLEPPQDVPPPNQVHHCQLHPEQGSQGGKGTQLHVCHGQAEEIDAGSHKHACDGRPLAPLAARQRFA